MKHIKYLSYILLILVLIPTVSVAQEMVQTNKLVVCGSSLMIMNGLDEEYGETKLLVLGAINQGEGYEKVIATVHQNEVTKTFSILETAASGISCIISSGVGLMGKKVKDKPDESEVPNSGTKTLLYKGKGIVIKF